MRTTRTILFVCTALALALMACRLGAGDLRFERVTGSGKLASEERTVQNVERVSLRGSGELTIRQGDEEGLTVEADDNVLPYIETEMQGSELVLKTRDGVSFNNTSKIRYTLRVKDLSRISISGSGDVKADAFRASDLALEISGSGNVNMDQLIADELTVRVSGSGNLNLSGEGRSQDVTISGSGNYDASDLACERASLTITGAGDMTVWAEQELDIRITGSGTVRYYGQPTITQRITGGGTIRSLGEHE